MSTIYFIDINNCIANQIISPFLINPIFRSFDPILQRVEIFFLLFTMHCLNPFDENHCMHSCEALTILRIKIDYIEWHN